MGRGRRIGTTALLVVLVSSVAVLGAATAAWAPSFILIDNGTHQVQGGTFLNAQRIADTLVSSSIVAQATTGVDVGGSSGLIDLSTSSLGTPQFDLSVVAPVVRINQPLNLAATGHLTLGAPTALYLGAPVTSGGSLIDPSRVSGTATEVYVENNAASIQQAIEFSSQTAPVTIHISSGTYTENLVVDHEVTLTGTDGTGPAGADPGAPTIVGTQPGGNVITTTSSGVTVDGLNLDGTVNGGSSANSADGVYASGVDALTVEHNTLTNFSGPGIETPRSTNVTEDTNAIGPTKITSGDATTFSEGSAGSFSVTSTGTPSAAMSKNGTLPNGVTFTDHGDGTATLGGTPAAGTGGTYPVTITASNGVFPQITQDFTLTVNGAPTFRITTSSLPNGALGASYSGTLSAAGGTAPYKWNKVSKLPSGLHLKAKTGVISGIPKQHAGTFAVTVQVTDATNATATATLSFTIGPGAVQITTANLPAGTLGAGYSATLTATQGTAPYHWKHLSKLPKGLKLSSKTGVISGTPTTQTGTFTVGIRAQDKYGATATKTFTVTIS